MKPIAIIIGSGIAGIATAIRLATLGYHVEVFEKNTYPGGKLSEINLNGFRFDAGPSLFTLPELVEELYRLAGKPAHKYFHYIRLPKITEYFFANGKRLTAYADPEKFAQEASEKLGEPAENVLSYLKESKELFEMTEPVFLKKSLHRLSTYLSLDTLKAFLQLHRLDNFRSLHRANEQSFKTAEMIQLFNRYATYNGSNPFVAPATLKVIPHLEFGIGAFFPTKGMYHITQSLVDLAREVGVKFHFGSEVSEIYLDGKYANGIIANGQKVRADIVVSNMDIVATYRKLLKNVRPPQKLLSQTKSSSAIIFYWGIQKTFPQLDLHNIFFSSDYEEEFRKIFIEKKLADDLTVYVNISSKYLPTDAPRGCENWFVMINAPANEGQDWDSLIAHAKKVILEKLSRHLEVSLADLIVAETTLDPRTIESKTSSSQGALYGNSSNTPYAAFFRHPNFSQQIRNLYFCGGSVHPGGGIPLSLLSAKIVGDLVSKKKKLLVK